MRFVKVLSMSILMAMITTYALADIVLLNQVGAWQLSATYDDKTSAFIQCNIMSPISRSSLLLHLSKEYQQSAYIVSRDISGKKGDSKSVTFNIDKGSSHNQIITFDGLVKFHVSDLHPSYFFNYISSGRLMFWYIDDAVLIIPIDGAREALKALENCVRFAPSTRPQAPPQAATTPPSLPPSPKRHNAFGSGFFVRSEGSGITNAHVVNGCTIATIEGYGRARITARDKTNDLALVQLTEPKRTEAVQFARRSLKLGEFVYALGFPLPGIIDNGLNFTGGQVSSLSGLGGDTRHFQLSAPIQPGNSGGPVVNTSGQLVGVTRARLDDVATLEASGALPQNVNYAIRSDIAASFLRANGIDPSESESAAKLDPTDIATAGRGYTFQIRCTVE